MSKRIKQDYEEQKRQAAENNPINQLETFHAESMTMEAHKGKQHYRKRVQLILLFEILVLGKISEKTIMSTLFKCWDTVKSKSSLCTINILRRVSSIYPNEIDMFYSNLHTIGALFDLFQHVNLIQFFGQS